MNHSDHETTSERDPAASSQPVSVDLSVRQPGCSTDFQLSGTITRQLQNFPAAFRGESPLPLLEVRNNNAAVCCIFPWSMKIKSIRGRTHVRHDQLCKMVFVQRLTQEGCLLIHLKERQELLCALLQSEFKTCYWEADLVTSQRLCCQSRTSMQRNRMFMWKLTSSGAEILIRGVKKRQKKLYYSKIRWLRLSEGETKPPNVKYAISCLKGNRKKEAIGSGKRGHPLENTSQSSHPVSKLLGKQQLAGNIKSLPPPRQTERGRETMRRIPWRVPKLV